MIRKYVLTFYITSFLLLLSGCNSTKYVPDDRYLLKRVIVKNSNSDIANEEITPYIRQRPNSQIFGFWRFHLGLYNLSGADQTHWWNRWFRKIGEEPVLFDENYVSSSSKQIKQSLINKGFFQASVGDSIIYSPSNKKVKVIYYLNSGPQYTIYDLKYKIADDTIREIIYKDSINTLLKPNAPFSSYLHDKERDRLSNILRNNGYYAFSKEYIWFMSDSLYGNQQIGDSLIVNNQLLTDSTGKGRFDTHTRYRINKVSYNLNYVPQIAAGDDPFRLDTLEFRGNRLYYNKLYIKPSVLIGSSQIEPGAAYNAELVQRTQNMLSGLRVFNLVNINFKETNQIDSTGYKLLDCNVSLARSKAQFYSLGLEGTNSSGNFGIGTKFKYQHKNLFKGAELFNFDVRVAAQRQYTRSAETFNTIEVGTDVGIEFPKFLVPLNLEKFRRKYYPKTALNVSYNYQKRPDYIRTLATAQMSYNWRSSRFVLHNLKPISLNYVKIPYVDPVFWAQIDSSLLRYSYEDHLIVNASYSYVFNQQRPGLRENFWYFRGTVEEAGNLLNTMDFLTKDSGEGYRTFLNVRYAQYVKTEFDLHYTHFAGKINSFAYRAFGGIGYSYGNMNVLPFEEQYFSGGANGIRAWPVRGIGPGSNKPPTTEIFNQMGDIKLEMNAEYRFKLFWVLEGAVFLDAGNIWLAKYSELAPLGQFKLDTFYKQIAIGTGAGMRMDFNYFLIRLDLGIQARDPSRPEGDRWVLGNRPLSYDRMALNFAIGYPF